jgi:hypothetical protein
MDQCPRCREQFLDTRNMALEDVASRCYCSQSCPVPALDTQKCSWTGNYDQIKNHLEEEHRDKCYDYGEEELRTVEDFHTVGFYFKFMFAFNEVFYQVFLRRGDTFYVSVYYIGQAENASKYKYKVEFINGNNTESVSVMHLTRSFNKKTNYLLKSGNCGKMLYDEISHLTNEAGDLSYKIEILRVGD